MTKLLAAGAALVLVVLTAFPGDSLARRDGSQRGGGEPGRFDYYVMALSWSPTYCAEKGPREGGPQCSGTRPYAFVLHGLWPQYDRGWPEFCETGRRPWVPEATINSMLDIMPSQRLIIHQYRKHGTCAGLSPEEYFRISRRLFESVVIPERYRLPEQPVFVSPDEVERDFIKANPGLGPDMIAVSCGGRRLQELRICFGRDLKLRSCGENESQRRLCARDELLMPPVRPGRGARAY